MKVSAKIITPLSSLVSVSLLVSVLMLGLLCAQKSYSETSGQASNLSVKERIQLQVKSNVQQTISSALKTAVANCKAEVNKGSCQRQYPFRLLHKDESIANLSACFANQTLLCISKQLASRAS